MLFYFDHRKNSRLNGLLQHLADDKVEGATVGKVGHLGLGVEAELHSELADAATLDGNGHILARLGLLAQVKGEGLLACQAKRISVLAVLELEGNDSEEDKVGAVDSLVGHSNDKLDAMHPDTLVLVRSEVTLAAQSRLEPEPYIAPAKMHRGVRVSA